MSTTNLNIRICLLQTAYFVLMFGLKYIFHIPCTDCERVFYIQSNIEIILEGALFLGLTVSMCYCILKAKKMFATSIFMGLSLWLLFEASKYIAHLAGFFPHYGDVPIMISMLLSFAVIFIYTCILYTICICLKRVVNQDIMRRNR